jgi:hypothetical protein
MHDPDDDDDTRDPGFADRERSEFIDALQKGLLLGVAILVLVIPPLRMAKAPHAPSQQPPVAQAPQSPQAAPQAPQGQPPGPGLRLADFNGEEPSPEARHVANWATFTHDHGKRAFVIVDKKEARVYVFGPDGKLRDSAPALLGAAHGDHTVPGIGEKPLELVKHEEKTTPAGRFVAEPGLNAGNEDVVWVDYDAAVSMHRIRPLVKEERRLERLASRTVDDNRISFGCINLPVSFYEGVLSPTVRKYGAIVYVLPETRTPQQLFGSFDPAQTAVAGKRT